MTLSAGEKVTHKSGGPMMVVTRVAKMMDQTDEALCEWFSESSDKFLSHRFPLEVLEKFSEVPDKE